MRSVLLVKSLLEEVELLLLLGAKLLMFRFQRLRLHFEKVALLYKLVKLR